MIHVHILYTGDDATISCILQTRIKVKQAGRLPQHGSIRSLQFVYRCLFMSMYSEYHKVNVCMCVCVCVCVYACKSERLNYSGPPIEPKIFE